MATVYRRIYWYKIQNYRAWLKCSFWVWKYQIMARNLEPACAMMARNLENTARKLLVRIVWRKTIFLDFKRSAKSNITVLVLNLLLTVLPVLMFQSKWKVAHNSCGFCSRRWHSYWLYSRHMSLSVTCRPLHWKSFDAVPDTQKLRSTILSCT